MGTGSSGPERAKRRDFGVVDVTFRTVVLSFGRKRKGGSCEERATLAPGSIRGEYKTKGHVRDDGRRREGHTEGGRISTEEDEKERGKSGGGTPLSSAGRKRKWAGAVYGISEKKRRWNKKTFEGKGGNQQFLVLNDRDH